MDSPPGPNSQSTRSDSHAWKANHNYDLLSIVAGIVPASPEFRSVRIEPHLGSLKHVNAILASPRGAISLVVVLSKPEPQATVTLPDGIDGTLVWNGREYPLVAGKRILPLPAAAH